MYKELPNIFPPVLGRLIVDKHPVDMGPPNVKDTVTVAIAEDVELYVEIENIEENLIEGEILAIGPAPREEFNGLCCGDKVQFEQKYVRAIIRND